MRNCSQSVSIGLLFFALASIAFAGKGQDNTKSGEIRVETKCRTATRRSGPRTSSRQSRTSAKVLAWIDSHRSFGVAIRKEQATSAWEG